ncbi:hypothetical protein LY76DRAFT_428663 [Colletotrichum caudatum]|nr:hypothetical protein LY76DRAFT_428663 [Colletotrichum caudatum]
MTAIMATNDWMYEITSDDEAGGPNSGIYDLDSELDHDAVSQRSRLRPIPGALPFLNYQSYDEQPPHWMFDTMQWKLTLNSRKAMKQTEQNILVPSDFWREIFSPKIAAILNSEKENL